MSQAGILNIQDGDLPGDVPLEFFGNGGSGPAVAVAHVLNVIGVGGASVTASGNTLTISVSSSGFTWNVVTSASPANPIQIIAENGYICDGASLVTFTLPLAPAIGDEFKIVSNTSRFQIAPNGGQSMRVGAVLSTAGSGTVTSNTVGDRILFTYVGGNLFIAEPPQGTVTIT